MKLKLVTLIASFLALLFISAGSASASEGFVDLKNSMGNDSRCHATSVFMPDFNYTVLITCSDLIYPVNAELLYYVVWATPLQGGDPIRFGDLGFGKVMFRTPTSFSSIFITQERQNAARIKTPGTVVMRGNVRGIPFLQSANNAQAPEATDLPILTPEPTVAPTGLFSRFKTGTIVIIVSIFIIIAMLILVKPFK